MRFSVCFLNSINREYGKKVIVAISFIMMWYYVILEIGSQIGRYYTIYRNKTDEIVAAGNMRECATQLGVKPSSMYSIISKNNKGKRKTYTIVFDDSSEADYEEEC